MVSVPDPDEFSFSSFVYEANADIFDTDKLIAFTWSPNPDKYPSSEPRRQYKCLLNHCLLSIYKCCDRFCIVPELNANGNVHIHGWLHVKDKIKYFKWFLPRCRQYGFVLCKTSVDSNWYNKYLVKEIDTTVGVIGEDLPIPLTHNNIEAYRDIYNKGKTLKYIPKKLTYDLLKYLDIAKSNK